MKKVQKLIGAVMVLLLFAPVVLVTAQAEQETNEQQELQATTLEQTQETTATENQTDDNLSNRLKQYKEKRTQALDTAKQNRLKGRCASAQGKVTSLTARLNQVKVNRTNAYSQIGEKLDNVIAKAKAAGIDVSTLETARADLRVEIDAFSVKFDEYLVTLTDLAEMDCASDPEAFQAALEISRQTRAELAEEAEAIRKLVKEDIKALLAQLRISLASAQGDDQQTENTQTTEQVESGEQ